MRGYADCYRWILPDAERAAWCGSSSPVLGSLRVFSAGMFMEARGHWWERTHLDEGVLIYCSAGRGWFRQDGRDWEVRPGDLLYAPRLSHHRYWADAKEPWSIHWMHLSGGHLPHYERLLGLLDSGRSGTSACIQDILADFTRLVLQHAPTPGAASWFVRQAGVLSVLGRIAALPADMKNIGTAYGPVQRALTAMDAALDRPFDLAAFAREAGCGGRHFSRQFRRVTGQAPGEMVHPAEDAARLRPADPAGHSHQGRRRPVELRRPPVFQPPVPARHRPVPGRLSAQGRAGVRAGGEAAGVN
ncbi:MAG: AraC family ligand binding domain-containing protein [Kiritimatiellia bacterium]